ncbi:winged helix-turn-helix transcriptional regulator [Polymorphospora lycopeni]|uniref:Helix-turn-helix domain-containing protein n=1 Tax=Polymorphospora lycopeni TaxID=3140240 RepID=A0ABV5CZG6_9ACTN
MTERDVAGPAGDGTDPAWVRAAAEATAREVFAVIGTKWALDAVNALAPGTLRFAELRRELPGISHKVLTQTLRALERDGIVARTVHPTVPPRVDYRLTAAGRGLRDVVNGMCDWSRRHLAEILAARTRSGPTG